MRATLTVVRDLVVRVGFLTWGAGCVGVNADLWGLLRVEVGEPIAMRPFALTGREVASKVVSFVLSGVVVVVGAEMGEIFSCQVVA